MPFNEQIHFNKQLLVVINPKKDEQVALNKAIRLAEKLGNTITALLLKKYATPSSLEKLNKKLSVAALKGISIAIEVSDETSLLRAILRAQHETEFGLLIKEPHAPSIADHVFLSDDWKLLRGSRIPVLMVNADNHWEDGKPLLLCVDANPSSKGHQALNARVLRVGLLISKVSNGQVDLVAAYPSQMQSGSKKDQVPALQEAEYRATCHEMLAHHDMPDEHIHVDQGPPELLIPEVAKKTGAELVVLGTVARSGLKGVLLGNTAEQILSRLKTDIYILPPKE